MQIVCHAPLQHGAILRNPEHFFLRSLRMTLTGVWILGWPYR
jgi:hypothetical protein